VGKAIARAEAGKDKSAEERRCHGAQGEAHPRRDKWLFPAAGIAEKIVEIGGGGTKENERPLHQKSEKIGIRRKHPGAGEPADEEIVLPGEQPAGEK